MDNSVERIDTEANLVDQPADKNAINISQGSSDDGNGRIPGSLIKESPVQTVQSHQQSKAVVLVSNLDPHFSDESGGAGGGSRAGIGSIQGKPRDSVENSIAFNQSQDLNPVHMTNPSIQQDDTNSIVGAPPRNRGSPQENPVSILKASSDKSNESVHNQRKNKFRSLSDTKHTMVKFDDDRLSQKSIRGDSFVSGESVGSQAIRQQTMKRKNHESMRRSLKPRVRTKLGNLKLTNDPNPTNISNLTALNLDGMSFNSELPEYVGRPDFIKNKKFNKKLVKHTLHKVYGVESVFDINYKKKLNQLIIAIGTHRVNDGNYIGISFKDPSTEKDINCFDFIAKFIETPVHEFKDMSPEEQKSRIKYLWKKLRLIVRTKGFIAQVLFDRTIRKIDMHALSTDQSFELPTDQEREEKLIYVTENFDDLPWYLMNPESTFARVQNIQVQIMTWSTLFITPLILTFPEQLKENLLFLEWIVDISWSLEICMKFIVADKQNRKFKDVAKNYLFGFFIFDVVATIPPMVYMERNNKANTLKMLRLVHIREVFSPFYYPTSLLMRSNVKTDTDNAYQLVVLVLSAFLFAHLAACVWVNIAQINDEEPGISFIWNQKTNPEASDYEQWVKYDWSEIYIFSLYWVFTVITTVGYGDFAGGNKIEWIFTIFLEFLGLAFVAIVTGLLTPLVQPKQDFLEMLSTRMFELDLWVMKLQRAADKSGQFFIVPSLYKSITGATEMAFNHDFNLIVEEGENFYKQLAPRDQTALVNRLFGEFILRFASFFDPCEKGFRNELIINLATRRYPRGEAQRSIVLYPHSNKMSDLLFITQGIFALTNKEKVNPTKPYRPFLLLPRNTIYGDYQILFDLYLNIDFRTYVEIPDETELFAHLPAEDTEKDGEYVFMCVPAESVKDLCDLYHATSETIKYKSLDRRHYYMKCMDRQWAKIKGTTAKLPNKKVQINQKVVEFDTEDKSAKTIGLKEAENVKVGENKEDSFEEEKLDYTKIKLRKDEVDVEEGPQGSNEQKGMNELRQAMKNFKMLKECTTAILHDIKDGSLARVRPSTYTKNKGENDTIMSIYSEDKSDIGSYYLNYYKMPPKEQQDNHISGSDSEESKDPGPIQTSPYSQQNRKLAEFTSEKKQKQNREISEMSQADDEISGMQIRRMHTLEDSPNNTPTRMLSPQINAFMKTKVVTSPHRKLSLKRPLEKVDSQPVLSSRSDAKLIKPDIYMNSSQKM